MRQKGDLAAALHCARKRLRAGGAAQRSRRLVVEWLESRTLLALAPQLLADINLGAQGSLPYGPPVEFGGELFLSGGAEFKKVTAAESLVSVQDASIADRLT